MGPAAVRLQRCGRSRRGRGRAVRETFPAILTNASLYSIAAQWNRTGVKTNGGNAWTGRSVKQMMSRPRYAGFRFYRDGILGSGLACDCARGRAAPPQSERQRRVMMPLQQGHGEAAQAVSARAERRENP